MGVPQRLIPDDAAWARVAPHIIGNGRARGSPGRDNRMFVEAVLWIARTGSPWRDLPEAFGGWNSVLRRFETDIDEVPWIDAFVAAPPGSKRACCSCPRGRAGAAR